MINDIVAANAVCFMLLVIIAEEFLIIVLMARVLNLRDKELARRENGQ